MKKIILIALVSCNLSAHNLKMITLNENGLPPVDSGLTLHRESTVGRLDKSIPNVFIYSQMIADNALFEMSTKREPWALVAPDLDPNGITDIKLNLSDVKLDFQYKAKKYPADYKLQGFAVNGTVDKDGRWSGISEFFYSPQLGLCTYSVSSFNSLSMDEARLEFDVQGMPGTKTIAGVKGKALEYEVLWVKGLYTHTIDCYRKDYDENLLKPLLELANGLANQEK